MTIFIVRRILATRINGRSDILLQIATSVHRKGEGDPMYTLECEMMTSCSLQETFKVFEDPHNLAKITPSWLNFRVTTAGDITMKRGAEIAYRIKWLGLPMRWKTVIREYQPPYLFVDEQAHGPYRYWRHTHTFVQEREGTRVKDHVEYKLPLGVLGRATHAVMVKWQLLGIFRYRQRQLAKLLGGNTEQLQSPTIRLTA